MTDAKMKEPTRAEDFGVPVEWAERAENYANFVRYAEREACAKKCLSLIRNEKRSIYSTNEKQAWDEGTMDCHDAILQWGEK